MRIVTFLSLCALAFAAEPLIAQDTQAVSKNQKDAFNQEIALRALGDVAVVKRMKRNQSISESFNDKIALLDRSKASVLRRVAENSMVNGTIPFNDEGYKTLTNFVTVASPQAVGKLADTLTNTSKGSELIGKIADVMKAQDWVEKPIDSRDLDLAMNVRNRFKDREYLPYLRDSAGRPLTISLKGIDDLWNVFGEPDDSFESHIKEFQSTAPDVVLTQFERSKRAAIPSYSGIGYANLEGVEGGETAIKNSLAWVTLPNVAKFEDSDIREGISRVTATGVRVVDPINWTDDQLTPEDGIVAYQQIK